MMLQLEIGFSEKKEKACYIFIYYLDLMQKIDWLQGNQLAGVVGGSGGLFIIPAVIQVFLNNFILGMEPLGSIQHPRIYHKVLL